MTTSQKSAEMPATASEDEATTPAIDKVHPFDADPSVNAFLDSMTFANGRACDCDECGTADAVPGQIRQAAAAAIRKRKAEQPSVFDPSKSVCLRQTRTLVRRDHGISVWRYELPPERNPEPIVEYRNSHRIIFVRTMSPMSRIYSIGKGVIGSKDEEESRRRVNWTEGAAFILPHSKGVATGWIHRTAEDSGPDLAENEAEKRDEKVECGPPNASLAEKDGIVVVFYAIKATPDAIKSLNDCMPPGAPPWIMTAHELLGSADEVDTSCVHEIEGLVKSADETLKVSQVIELAEGKT